MENRIEFPLGSDAISFTASITTYAHGLFAGWWHGALLDSSDVRVAYTTQAYPSKLEAIKAISRVLVDNVIYA